ncbi:MAG: hypothetical protein ACKVOT_16825 [Polaromonas sp.]
MINTDPYRRVAEVLRREIEDFLNSVGFLCRVFGRGKSTASLHQKILSNPGKYTKNGRLIQDAVGIRVVLYSTEDIVIVEEILRQKYKYDRKSSTIDVPNAQIFSVTRHNLIFQIPEQNLSDMNHATGENPVDFTFELQIRTILSEGWHEVEHDLRYKRLDDWKQHDDLSRSLNGVVATLETAEWSMRKIFEDLAHRHYKNRNWEAMLHTSLRMRISSTLSSNICSILNADAKVAKLMFRLDRATVLRSLSKLAPKIPINLDNMIYLWNYICSGSSSISEITPAVLLINFEANLIPITDNTQNFN